MIAKPRLNYGSDLAQWDSDKMASSGQLLMTALEGNISNLLILLLIDYFHFHYYLLI